MSDTFEEFLIKCCETNEVDLRIFLKEVLLKNGFRIIEDNYKSPRGNEYSSIHNMLAIRGDAPKICLVSHTDVCRDHEFSTGRNYAKVNAVIKEKIINGIKHEIIQDRDNSIQVGGDDRVGVAISTWIALNNDYDMGLLFTTDEEIGLISASQCEFPELNEFELLCQIDRGNHSNQIVNEICGIELCSLEVAIELLQIAEDIGLPRRAVNGLPTDVLCIKANDFCKNAVNMTCGYHESYGNDKNEYIIISEAKECLKYVSSIIEHYELEDDDKEKINSNKREELIKKITANQYSHRYNKSFSTTNSHHNNNQIDDDEVDYYEQNFWY